MPKLTVVIPGAPIGKPRMTRSDKWRKRPCVMKYRAWADHARLCVLQQVGKLPPAAQVIQLQMVAQFEPPLKIGRRKLHANERAVMYGLPHREKPDWDNIAKCQDSLYEDDKQIPWGGCRKVYGPVTQLEITIEYEEETDVDSRSSGPARPSDEGSRKAKVRTRVGSPRTRRGTGHESVPVEHILA